VEDRRIKLLVEYDGTEFAGFQLQGKGERTVQGVLQQTIAKMSGTDVIVHGAGRTDSGVHARGQVVHFDTAWRVPIDRVSIALNGALPPDIAVRTSAEVERDFHARFSATQRTYIYLMWTMPQRSALWGRFATHEPKTLNVETMQRAAKMLQGSRDFGAFANKSEVSPSTTVRDVSRFEIKVLSGGKFLAFRLTANGFLRSMVRNLVGGLRSVGLGEIDPSELIRIAETADRTKNPCASAPATGLCLWRVDY
jgi:tRNA pseudouridine38-40 synthase